MKQNIKYLFCAILIFVLGGVCAFLGRRLIHHNKRQDQNEVRIKNPPFVVELKETNLPIILISTDGKQNQITRENSVLAKMCIIFNGDDELNYADTVSHRGQHVEYEGNTYIHIRGATSTEVAKKSYSLHLVTGSDGKGEKHALFGWKKSSKWCLLAEHKDGSLMRDALTYDLARPYFDFVPHVRHCELVMDGVYQGVYLIAEKASRDRLGIKKSDENDAFCSGGFLVEKNRGETFRSKYPARDISGKALNSEGLRFEVGYPNNPSNEQLEYIQTDFGRMEDAIATGMYSEYSKHIDVLSFASYHLLQEFTNNPDGFVVSQKIYKSHVDTVYKMAIWDFDVCYGISVSRDGWYTNILRTNSKSYQDERPFWWERLAQDTVYRGIMKNRWEQFREGEFKTIVIEKKIDSLQHLLTVHHAVERNAKAWKISEESNPLTRPHQFDECVNYIRSWIICRVDYLDSVILGIPNNTAKCDSACMEIGRVILFKK